MTMTMAVSRSSVSPSATGFSESTAGSGQPHMVCPMEIYIKTIRKPRELTSRFFKRGVSWSARASACAAALAEGAASWDFGEAP